MCFFLCYFWTFCTFGLKEFWNIVLQIPELIKTVIHIRNMDSVPLLFREAFPWGANDFAGGYRSPAPSHTTALVWLFYLNEEVFSKTSFSSLWGLHLITTQWGLHLNRTQSELKPFQCRTYLQTEKTYY